MTTHILSHPMNPTQEPSSRHVAHRAADAVPAQPRQARVLRFLALTVFGAPANIAIYALLLHWTGMAASVATVVAAMFVIIPKFVASKYWVWKARDSNRVAREASVYVFVTACSLAVATAVAWVLDSRGATDMVLVLANLATFAVMWVVRFMILDLFGFVPTPTPDPST